MPWSLRRTLSRFRRHRLVSLETWFCTDNDEVGCFSTSRGRSPFLFVGSTVLDGMMMCWLGTVVGMMRRSTSLPIGYADRSLVNQSWMRPWFHPISIPSSM